MQISNDPPYLPWTIEEKEFPHTGTIWEQACFLLCYALLAANSHNTQPWAFAIKGNVIELAPDFTHTLPHSDPCNRQLFLSLGCALGNLVVTAEHFGFSATVAFPSHYILGNPIASVSLSTPQIECQQGALFSWITKRRMDRRPYYPDWSVPNAFFQDLLRHAHDLDIITTMVTDPSERECLLDLVEQSTLGIHRPEVLQEWSHWFRPLDTQEEDGLPPFDFTVPEEVIPVEVQARETRQLFATAPLFLVLSSVIDDEEHWVRAGITLAYASLIAEKYGLSQAPWGAMIEHEETAQQISSLLHSPRPVYFARLGYAKGGTLPHHTPRRPVERILMNEEEL